MFVYNLILSLMGCWSVFKIYQYYEAIKNIQGNRITCFIDGISDDAEEFFTYVVFITLFVVASQIMITILKCIQHCCCCTGCNECCGPNVDSLGNCLTRYFEYFILLISMYIYL